MCLQALCIPCSETGVGRGLIAMGRGRFHYGNLMRHEKRKSHKRAVYLMQERAKEETLQCYTTNQESAPVRKVKTIEEIPQTLTSCDFLFMRLLLETRGSFRGFESWAAAACDGESTGHHKVNRLFLLEWPLAQQCCIFVLKLRPHGV